MQLLSGKYERNSSMGRAKNKYVNNIKINLLKKQDAKVYTSLNLPRIKIISKFL